MIEEVFLRYSVETVKQHRGRIHDCVGLLSEEQIWTRNKENENSAGNLILHLAGNLRQWIGFGIAGLDNIRDRDSEFAARGGMGKDELLARLDDAVDGAVAIIAELDGGRLAEHTTIQNYNVTVLEAIYHVVEHFAQHTGQIIFLTKLLRDADLGYYAHLSQPAHPKRTP